jgi:hypothetical protein
MHTHYSTSYTRVEIICALIYIVLSARFMFKTSLHTKNLERLKEENTFWYIMINFVCFFL